MGSWRHWGQEAARRSGAGCVEMFPIHRGRSEGTWLSLLNGNANGVSEALSLPFDLLCLSPLVLI